MSQAEQPTKTRYAVVGLAVSLAVLTYIDRVAISQSATLISTDLGLGPKEMGYVFSAFGLTYALLEIPSGWLCDSIGPRKVVTRIVLWWSLFTALTGWAWNLTSMVVIRLLFGAGEAGCFPSLAKIMSTWLPMSERPMGEGFKACGARLAAAVTPAIVYYLNASVGWRNTFAIFGVIGIAWAIGFHLWYRDNPAAHPGVNEAERQLLSGNATGAGHTQTGVPWGVFVRSGSAWALCLQWFCHYYGFYFYITWLPTYLQQARHLDMRQGAILAGLPMLCAAAGSLTCGWLIPRVTALTGSLAVTRKWMGYIAYGGASVLLLLFTTIADPIAAMAVMSLSAFIVELSGPVSWTTAMDLGGRYVGTLSAAMNMMGHLGGSAAPTVIGWTLATTGNNWTVTFYCSACVYMAGVFCWMAIDPVTPLDRRESDGRGAHPQ